MTDVHVPENSRIVQASYLEKHSSKKDLIQRLRTLQQVLQEDESIEPDGDEFPGLAATCHVLSQTFLEHVDKQIRLYTVQCCMELFAIYAPEAPWDTPEILAIFRQTIRQLANLAHTTASQPLFANYMNILDLLANVKIGVVLVELCKTAHPADDDEAALEVLAELVRTLLHSIRVEHPPQVSEYVVAIVNGIIDEYEKGVHIPVAILDELLACIGQGPTVSITKLQQNVPTPGTQPNPSYLTAATIVRVTSNKIATPLENLLNGLLNRQSHVVEASSISAEPPPTDSHDKVPDVYTIVYELHKVAPTCLATVLGTVTNGLTHEDTVRRTATVQLLGRIFVATPVVAKTHHASFGAWLGRAVDAEVPIRKTMVALLRQLVLTDASAPDVPDDIRQQAVPALCTLIQDVDVLVRLDAIQAVCDGAYHETARHGPASLLHAVGQRVSSKHKQERRNAVTGLAQLYFSRFLRPALVHVHNGGDDVELDVIRQTLHHGCRLDRPLTRKGRKTNTFPDADAVDVEDECYRWIPRKVMEALCFTDQTDSEMRSRVSLILDEILLGSDLSSKSSKRLTSTARAVGLVMIVDSIRDGSTVAEGSTSTPEKFLRQWLAARATLQMTLRRYLDARATKRQHPHGTEEALTADAKAAELLETVASLTAVPSKSLPDVLEAFHGIRDKHVFNILATITDPTHSPKARARALEDLPKRTKSLGDAVSLWVKNLARRCVMGDFVNAEIVNHCVLLAQECFAEGDIAACTALLSPVKLVADIFPALCAVPKTFTTLTEVFSECRNATGAEAKREIQETSIITTLSSIMSAAAATDARSFKHAETHTSSDDDDFRKELMLLCTRDGTPEQARNAVYTLAQLLRKESDDTKGFEPLLKALTSTTRMTVSGKESVKLVSVLSALAAFTDCAPALLEGTEKGNKAINFALECVLMGRRQDGGDEGYDSADEDGETRTPSPSSRKNSVSSTRKRPVQETPEWGGSLLEDESLSTSCRKLCAAIEFLVSYVRSTTLQRKEQKITTPTTNELPSQLFVLLTQIIQDHGLPTSNRDRRSCRSRQDRAALRQCASTHILRLCDSRLGLEKSLLTPGMWHTLGSALLDEELAVREGIFEEYLRFLKGSGPYGSKASHSCTLSCSSTPSLRLVSLVVLCTDGHACASHDLSNGNAANVGRMSSSVKATALGCIGNLRKLCDAAYAQCRAQGKDTEEKFEKQYKMMLMPEYSVPFACHLLSHRRETPCIEASSSEMDQLVGVGNDEDAVDREGQQKVLRRRLKYLLEPLVQSLGDGADNISFLLRMTEILAKHYHPVDISTYGPTLPRKSTDSSMESAGNTSTSNPKLTLLEGKLKTVCAVARDVLLSFVEKDVNLSTYPGTIQLPANLFRKAARGPAIRQSRSARNASVEAGPHAGLSAHRSVGASGGAEKEQASGALPSAAGSKSNEGYAESSLLSPSAKSSLRKRFRDTLQSPDAADTSLNTRVQFSPDVLEKTASRNGRLFGLSPIPKSNSPIQALGGSSRRTSPRLASPASSGAETLGTSPPSVLHGNMIATMASTAADDSTDKEYLSSPGTIGTMESKEDSGVLVVESESKEKTDGQDNALSYDSSTEFKTTSETQSTNGTLDSIHRQGSRRSPRNMNQDGTSKGRPRRACKPLGLRSDVEIPGASREKGQKRKSRDDTRASLQESPSTHRQNKCQLKVNRAGTTKASNVELGLSKHRSRVSEKMDELDFDFGDSDGPENRLVRRNQSKATATATAKIITTKSVPGKKKSTASKALSKTRKAVLRSR